MDASFLGFWSLEDRLRTVLPITNGNQTPFDPAVVPNVRIYDGLALLTVGSLAKVDTGSITDASNATPIVIQSTGHGLETGNRVAISGVGGNAAANGNFTITKVNANSFSLDGSVGNGSYTSGGQWHVAGAYGINMSLGSPLFEAGKNYQMLTTYTDGTTTYQKQHSFAVV